jgi:hypothetical protein
MRNEPSTEEAWPGRKETPGVPCEPVLERRPKPKKDYEEQGKNIAAMSVFVGGTFGVGSGLIFKGVLVSLGVAGAFSISAGAGIIIGVLSFFLAMFILIQVSM